MQTSDDMTNRSMKPIVRKSLAEEVAENIKHQIKKGALPLNEKLPAEPELMTFYGVGRSSIREAIKILSQSGFVSVQQGLGTFVISRSGNDELSNKLQEADFAEVYQVRKVLEFEIIAKACQFRTAKDITLLRERVAERGLYAQEGELRKCIHSDIAYHTLIAESCGNSILAQLYKTLSVYVEKFFDDVYTDTVPFIDSQDLHIELIDQIEAQDAEKAVEVVRKIIGNL